MDSFKVIFFGYSWTADFKPDAYQRSLIEALINRGAEVHLILSNYLAADGVSYGIHPLVSEDALMKLIKSIDPTLIIALNGGGLRKELRDQISAPIVTWIVDDFAHLFYPDGARCFDTYVSEKDPLISSSWETFEIFRKLLPSYSSNIHFIPSATDVKAFSQHAPKKEYDISFVGSWLDLRQVESLFRRIGQESPEHIRSLLAAMDMLERDYRHDFDQTIQSLGLAPILKQFEIEPDNLKMILSNVISARDRQRAVMQTCDLGLALFGNDDWVRQLLLIGEKAVKSFKFEKKVRTHADLVDVYQKSKISFNVAQIQTGPALSYRAFDVMASSSLLIQPYREDSDAFKIFGSDCPIPMYRDFDHLRELCRYYLENESERLKIVAWCNKAISQGFTFDDRVMDLLRIAKIEKPRPSENRGQHFVNPDYFRNRRNWPWYKRNLKEVVRDFIDDQIVPIVKAWLQKRIRKMKWRTRERLIRLLNS